MCYLMVVNYLKGGCGGWLEGCWKLLDITVIRSLKFIWKKIEMIPPQPNQLLVCLGKKSLLCRGFFVVLSSFAGLADGQVLATSVGEGVQV